MAFGWVQRIERQDRSQECLNEDATTGLRAFRDDHLRNRGQPKTDVAKPTTGKDTGDAKERPAHRGHDLSSPRRERRVERHEHIAIVEHCKAAPEPIRRWNAKSRNRATAQGRRWSSNSHLHQPAIRPVGQSTPKQATREGIAITGKVSPGDFQVVHFQNPGQQCLPVRCQPRHPSGVRATACLPAWRRTLKTPSQQASHPVRNPLELNPFRTDHPGAGGMTTGPGVAVADGAPGDRRQPSSSSTTS